MKKLLVLGFLLVSQLNFGQDNFRLNDYEYFTVSTSIDPTSSIKEKGLDIVGEVEYVGVIYTKVGFENFSALKGGYTDIHGVIGLNFTSGYFAKTRYYIGARVAKVYREYKGSYVGWRLNHGLEGGIDYDINDNLFIGLRATYDKRHDQEILYPNDPIEIKFSGFIRLGYKWYYKNRRP